jgi:hypothetical protein
MKERFMAIIFIIITVLSIFAIGYRVAEMKYTEQDIITVYNQD